MSLYVEELQEQVLTACIAAVYVLDAPLNNWKAVDEQGGLSNVQLIQTRQNALYRIRGRLQSNGQIAINVILEKDVTYEVNDGDKSCHCLKSHNNVFCLKISPESNGDQFAVVVRNILRRLQDNPSSPREAWMPASVAPQSTVQLQPVKDHLLNSSNLGNKSPFQAQTLLRPQTSLPPQRTFQPQNKSSISDQHLTQSRNQGFAASTTSLVPSARPWYNAQKIGSWKHEFEVDQWCDRLSSAIQEGNIEAATEISKLMAEHNAALSIKQKNPKIITVNAGEDSFNLRVVVEDRETSGGAFAMKVSSTTTVTQLQEEVAERYGFPPKVQKWISGMKMAKPQETLSDLKLKGTGSTIYLYLVSGQSVGLKRQEFEHYVNKQEERKNAGLSMSMEMRTGDIQPPPVPSSALSGTQLSRTASLPSLPIVGQSIGSSASSNTVSTTPAAVTGIPVPREAQVMNPSQPAGNPANQGRIHLTSSISDIQQMISTLGNEGLSNAPELSRMNERPSVAVAEREVHVQPQGWICRTCTYMNTPTRPGCEMCGEDRPQDYVVPQNPQITEQEKARLEKERQETESFQRAGMLQNP